MLPPLRQEELKLEVTVAQLRQSAASRLGFLERWGREGEQGAEQHVRRRDRRRTRDRGAGIRRGRGARAVRRGGRPGQHVRDSGEEFGQFVNRVSFEEIKAFAESYVPGQLVSTERLPRVMVERAALDKLIKYAEENNTTLTAAATKAIMDL